MDIAGYRPNLSKSKKPETGFLSQLFNHRSPRMPRGTSGGSGLEIPGWKLREGQERNASRGFGRNSVNLHDKSQTVKVERANHHACLVASVAWGLTWPLTQFNNNKKWREMTYLLRRFADLSSIRSLVGSEIYLPVNIEMKRARCKITEIKDELLEHVEPTIHSPAPGNQLTNVFSIIVL